MVQNLKKVLKSKISKKKSFLRHEVPFKAKNNREAVVVCAKHVVKRPSKRSVLVCIKTFEVVFSTNNLSGKHISAMWHSLNVYKYFCPLSVYVMSILSNSRFYKINIQNADFVKSTFDKIDITYICLYVQN